MDLIDGARNARPGEELDVVAVESFLRDALPGLEGNLEILQFPGGHSNLTYLLRLGGREFVLRRPPFGTKAKTAHDMGREYRILNALKDVYPYGPKPLAYTEDESVMGCPFYVMERIRGIIVRRNFPESLSLTADQVSALYKRLLEVHVELHQVDFAAAGLADFGKPAGYVRRQVEGWSKRYRAARTPDAPDCEAVMGWLADHMPPDSEYPGIIHNDFRLDNAVLDPADPLKVIGILDWEMATLGDPLMDLGGSLAYWIQPGDPEDMQVMRFMPTTIDGAPTRRQIVDMYADMTGHPVENEEFYYVFGLFRLGVIAQQIYYRYYHGQTKDERFKLMVMGVMVLDNQARRVIEGAGL